MRGLMISYICIRGLRTYDNIFMTSSGDVYIIRGCQKDNDEDESCG